MARLFNIGISVDSRFGELIKAINKVSNLQSEEKKYFTKYLNDVKQGVRNNDFFEDDLLERVILEVISYKGYGTGVYNAISYFETLQSRAATIFVRGTDTDSYEMLKELFINCIRVDYDLFNDSLFVLFDNKMDYADIIHIISGNKELIKNAKKIAQFGVEVSTCGISQEELKSEIIAFANAVLRCDNVDELIVDRLNEARKKNGIYNISEKTLALSTSKLEKANSIMKKADNWNVIVNNHTERMQAMSEASIKDIEAAREAAIEELNGHVEVVKNSSEKQVGEFLKDLEADIKLKTAREITQAVEDASKKVSDMKIEVAALSTTAYEDYKRMQGAAQEAKEDFEKLLKDEPKLKELLSKLDSGKSITVAPATEVKVAATAPAVDGTVEEVVPEVRIPGVPRIIIPGTSDLIIPEKINSEILPAFDERIPFNKRLDVIKEKMRSMEKDGVIFHEMTEELVRCIMEGDWPYIWGPSGCGKSYLIDQVAELVGLDVVDNGKITEVWSIMGYNDPHGRFRATPAFIAVLYGKLLKLDELDNGNNDTHVVLNEIYSKSWETVKNPSKKRFITFGEDMRVPVNPNFRMMSAGNTDGEGPTEENNARNKIDESVQERYTPKRMYYDERVEKKIFGEYEAWFDLFIKFRRVCDRYADKHDKQYAPGIITTRDADAIARYIRHNSKSLDQILREKFIQIKDEEYIKDIITLMRREYENDPAGSISLEGVGDIAEKGKTLAQFTKADLGKKLIYVANRANVENRR